MTAQTSLCSIDADMVHPVVELAYTHFMVLTLKPTQNGRYFFADHIFSFIFMEEYVCILFEISQKIGSHGSSQQ